MCVRVCVLLFTENNRNLVIIISNIDYTYFSYSRCTSLIAASMLSMTFFLEERENHKEINRKT